MKKFRGGTFLFGIIGLSLFATRFMIEAINMYNTVGADDDLMSYYHAGGVIIGFNVLLIALTGFAFLLRYTNIADSNVPLENSKS